MSRYDAQTPSSGSTFRESYLGLAHDGWIVAASYNPVTANSKSIWPAMNGNGDDSWR